MTGVRMLREGALSRMADLPPMMAPSDAARPDWCVVCYQALGDDRREFPDGCVAHQRCFMDAPSDRVAMHMKTSPLLSEGSSEEVER